MDIVEASDPRKMDYLAKVLKNLIFSDIQNGDIILHNFGVQEYQGPYEQFKGEIWHYFDLHSPHRHDGKLVRQWYDFPPFDGSHDKDHETEVLLEASAIFESFLTSTPEKSPNMEYLERKP